MPIADSLRGSKCMLVASTGGHLAQLVRLSSRWGTSSDSLWVTFDTAQSRSLLAERRVLYVPYIAPRDVAGILRAYKLIGRARSEGSFDAVVSTGAGVALASHPRAVLSRTRTVYVESVSRTRGPSVTGRVLEWLPGIERYTPHATWHRRRWSIEPSVFSDYTGERVETPVPSKVRVFATFGTIRPYGFERLARALSDLPSDVFAITWQVGETKLGAGVPGEVHREVSPSRFRELCLAADVVVTHAGVGNLMEILSLGVPTVAVPRRSIHGEHVDDHQEQIAQHLGALGLVEVVEADDLNGTVLHSALSLRVASSLGQ